MTQETVIITTCKCGWMAVAENCDAATDMLGWHIFNQVDERGHEGSLMAMSNPVGNEVIAYLQRQSKVRRDELAALAFLERYKAPEQPRIVTKTHRYGGLLDRFMSGVAAIHYRLIGG